MNKWLMVSGLILTFLATNAHAQGLVDTAVGAAVGSASEFGVLSAPPIPTSVITNNLKQQGYTNFTVPAFQPGMPYEFTATSPAGTPVAISVDPRTGGIISAVPQ